MAKRNQNRFRFLPGGKKGSVRRIVSRLIVFLLLLLVPLLILSRAQPLPGRVATLSQSVNKTHLLTPHGSGNADVTVDFGSRQNTAYPIPSQFLGVGGIGMGTALNHAGSSVTQANFRLTKLGDYDFMSLIFPTAASLTDPSQRSWTKFDTEMTLVVNYHLQPIITLTYTPSWLQPQNQNPPHANPCLTNKPPAQPTRIQPMFMVNGQDHGPQVWGQLAALMVAHVDHNFPQVKAMYEIWNEPDQAQFMCVPDGDPNTQLDRLAQYKAIFAAAAPQMQQQANSDGTHIKIGGPALGYALQQQLKIWMPGLLTDPNIYPYIDFVTYHRYVFGHSFTGGSQALVTNAQDPVLGITAEYEQVAQAVQLGKQPNAANTPIYLDEYNMNSCVPNICRNDPTLAPLNNALFLADMLNVVNDSSTSFGRTNYVAAGLAFYTWNIPSGNICLFGVINTHMDCSTSGTIVPYPQYYTYLLFGGAKYLDMTNGGYVANAVVSNRSGVFATGFYTKTSDCIVIVNTTGTSYSAFNVLAQNPGTGTNTQATVYTLQYSKHPSSPISSESVSLVHAGGSATTVIHVPAYTTVAISLN